MALRIDIVSDSCGKIAQQVRDRFKALTIHYIAYHEGQRMEALGLAGQEITTHPAADIARHILAGAKPSEEPDLIGIAVAQKPLMFGLARQDSLLALCAINVDQHETLRDVRRSAWHLAWHAIDSMFYRTSAGRGGLPPEIVTRRRNKLEMLSANMQADVFAVTMEVLQGNNGALRRQATLRSMNALQPRAGCNPECYPFVLAMESTIAALKKLKKKPMNRKKHIDTALKTAWEINYIFGPDAFESWLSFAESAQEMAWRHCDPAQILGAGINTSENTDVRAVGYLISDVTEIKATSAVDAREHYSPFADDLFNSRLHEKAVNEIFQEVVAEGMRRRSSDPFMEKANAQNLALTEGNVLGWCAAALQAAGKTFADALASGNKNPDLAAKQEFGNGGNATTWATLKTLGQKIVSACRQGDVIPLEKLADFLKGDNAAAALKRSVEMTLKDPSWRAAPTLEPVPAEGLSLAPEAPQPASPAPPVAAVRRAPPAAAAPGLGRPPILTAVRPATPANTTDSAQKTGGKDDARN